MIGVFEEIYARSRVNGTLSVYPLDPNSKEHTLIKHAKGVVQKLFKSLLRGEIALNQVAKECKRSIPGLAMDTEPVVKSFIAALQKGFPKIFSDCEIKELMGAFPIPNDLDKEKLDTVEFLINQERVSYMVEAHESYQSALKHEKYDISKQKRREVVLYQFQLICTLLRFIGQLFGWYLQKYIGPTINLESINPGVLLEAYVFGGYFDWSTMDGRCGSDPAQPGIPYQVTTSNDEIHHDENGVPTAGFARWCAMHWKEVKWDSLDTIYDRVSTNSPLIETKPEVIDYQTMKWLLSAPRVTSLAGTPVRFD